MNLEGEMKELKDLFIVDSKMFQQEKIPALIKRVLPFCRVSSTGQVFYEQSDITSKDKVVLALIARFLASRLDESIKASATIDEITASIGLPRPSAMARINDAMNERLILREAKGTYAVIPAYIEKFLDKIEKR